MSDNMNLINRVRRSEFIEEYCVPGFLIFELCLANEPLTRFHEESGMVVVAAQRSKAIFSCEGFRGRYDCLGGFKDKLLFIIYYELVNDYFSYCSNYLRRSIFSYCSRGVCRSIICLLLYIIRPLHMNSRYGLHLPNYHLN